jgi:hypothetical protein
MMGNINDSWAAIAVAYPGAAAVRSGWWRELKDYDGNADRFVLESRLNERPVPEGEGP